ncbi:MAG: Abi family protein [Eubacteriaceae bacterium]|nr:Abi family protein [Eubacteriaceae bacterium]
MDVKPATTYEEQVALLQSRGCIVEDKVRAIDVLSRVNYYRLSGYFYPFRNDDGTFHDGTSFEKIASIYDFDNRLRAVLSLAIGNAEIAARSEIAYFHALKYGALGYLNPSGYKRYFDPCILLSKFFETIKHNQNSPIIEHHRMKYNDQFPIWVAVEFFSMGTTSRFFSNLKKNDQKQIGNKYNASADQLGSWLLCLTNLRNVCAHYDRLYAAKFTARPSFPVAFSPQSSNLLFSQICVLKLLSQNGSEWRNSIVKGIAALLNEYDRYIELPKIGFPENWENILIG